MRQSVHPIFREYRCIGTNPDTPNEILKINWRRYEPGRKRVRPGVVGCQDLGARYQETRAHVWDTGSPL